MTADATTREHDTFPKLARANAARMPDHVAIREKDYGIWQCWSWAEVVAEVEAVARPAGPGPTDPNSGFHQQTPIAAPAAHQQQNFLLW